ncbi:MAG: pitrilysin family protein [Thermogemmata sp.]|nr:pitrilysin family protein [Thermogemmata sp.]
MSINRRWSDGWWFVLGCLVGTGHAGSAVRADEGTALAADRQLVQTVQGLFRNLQMHTLDNGLRIYLLPVPNSPIVTVMVAYRVGSADEEKDQTGLSHYLEHLLFKGTDKLMPGDIDRITQRNGGRNNAYTTEDMTVYHFDFAADRWQVALEIEADRMRNTRIDARHEFEQEKGAVIAELDRNEDMPWDLEYKAILRLLYPPDAPYSHPVIGQREHVRGATAEIIRRHYDNWYYPNNAALVIVGGFDPCAALKKVQQLFGPLPRGDLPPRKPARQFPERQGPVRHEFPSKFEAPRMLMGFNTVTVGTPEDAILDLIENILAGGRTSRLYRRLVEQERLAIAVNAANHAGRYPGWFAIQVELLQGKSRQQAEELVLRELEQLAQHGVNAGELARARRRLLARFVFAADDGHNLANAIARAASYPGGEDVARFYNSYLERLVQVQPQDVQRVVRQYLTRRQACIVWSVPPEKKSKSSLVPRQSLLQPIVPQQARANDRLGPSVPLTPAQRPGRRYQPWVSVPQVAWGVGRGTTLSPQVHGEGQSEVAKNGRPFSLQAAQRHVLPNGLTVWLWPDRRLPMVVVQAEVADVRLREPAEKAGVAALMGSLLEEGTLHHSGPQIAEMIENVGGSLTLQSNGGTLQVLSPDTDIGLSLFIECLTCPTFPQEAFQRLQAQQLATLDDMATQPFVKGAHLFRKKVYGDHPLGRPELGSRSTVEKLTAADCKAFHEATFVPNATTLVVVGDFDPPAMLKKIENLTRDWKAKPLPPLQLPPLTPGPGQLEILTDSNAAQVHVFIGHLGITRNHPDYYKLLVMDNVLGTGPGFTDRLSATLRDRMGLAYTVQAAITTTAGKLPGTFSGYIGTFPQSFRDVQRAFVKEIERIRQETPTEQEVEDAKKYLLGSLPFRFATRQGLAAQLLAIERYDLGIDYPERYRQAISSVTPAQVQEVAQKHLDPKRLIIVAVGPIDANGMPLRK